MLEIDDDVCAFGFRECVAMYADSSCCGEFSLDVEVGEYNRVVARRSLFVPMIECRFGVDVQRSYARHQQDIAVVRNARSTKVRVTESEDRVVGIVITGAGVPTFNSCIGTELHNAERQSCTWNSVVITVRADEGIDMVYHVLRNAY